MQIKQKKNIRTIYIVIAAVVMLFVVGFGIYWFFMRGSDAPNPTNQTTNTSTTPSVKNDSNDTTQTIDKTTDEVPTNKTGLITITSFNQKNGTVSARATTTNFDTKECIYSFTTDGGKPVIKEQTGNCAAISLSQDLFDKIGTYTLTVTAYSNDEKITTTREVDIR